MVASVEADLSGVAHRVIRKFAYNCHYLDIRVQQRNGRKSLTTIQGLDPRFDALKLVRAMQKLFNCNGTVVTDPDHGNVLQLTGDQRQKVKNFMISEYICTENELRIHGA